MLKRYVLFCCECYYPRGGWGDFVDSFDDLEIARQRGIAWEPTCGYGFWHVVDLTTGLPVVEGESDVA